jgi:predicted transcriptional regulator
MDRPIRRPEEILAYRSLSRILAAKPRTLWAVGPADSALTALQIMADKKTAFLVVVDQGQMVGVVSERDFVARVILAKKSSEATPVSDIMVRNVSRSTFRLPRPHERCNNTALVVGGGNRSPSSPSGIC